MVQKKGNPPHSRSLEIPKGRRVLSTNKVEGQPGISRGDGVKPIPITPLCGAYRSFLEQQIQQNTNNTMVTVVMVILSYHATKTRNCFKANG